MKISEVAKTLGVSPRTVYRRIETLSLTVKGHVNIVGKVKTLDLEGVELVRASLNKDNGEVLTCYDAENVKVRVATNDEENATIESYKTLLLEQKKLYESLILDKDKLVDELRKDKDRLMKMQENSQVLLVREQERVLMLEENKGFWSKFKKKQSI